MFRTVGQHNLPYPMILMCGFLKPMLGCATDYFVISKRKGRSEMHFWMEFVKKTLRYYAVTCTFAMCMAHDVRHLRPVHNEATIFLGFARTGSQFTRLIFLVKSKQVYSRTGSQFTRLMFLVKSKQVCSRTGRGRFFGLLGIHEL